MPVSRIGPYYDPIPSHPVPISGARFADSAVLRGNEVAFRGSQRSDIPNRGCRGYVHSFREFAVSWSRSWEECVVGPKADYNPGVGVERSKLECVR